VHCSRRWDEERRYRALKVKNATLNVYYPSEMKDTIDELKKTVFDEVIKASRSYVLREQVRAELQDIVVSRLKSGDINSAEDAEAFVQAMKAAVGILENVSFESWKLIAGSR
jgi:hypothetical protein